MQNSESNNNLGLALLNTREAADFLGVTPGFLEQARFRHTGPRYLRMGPRKGCLVRYRRSDLEAFLSACEVLPAEVVSGEVA